jgi:hypothetical protein
MDNGARNWMFKYCRKHHWRVASWIEFDDLVQEGYAAYYETLKRYPTAKEPKHIMSLFALVFRSKIEMMVRAKRKQVDDADSDTIETYDGDAVQVLDSMDFVSLITKAPQAIKDALLLFTTEAGRQELAKPYEVRGNGSRETTNDRFCKLLGKDPDTIDFSKELRMYFQM